MLCCLGSAAACYSPEVSPCQVFCPEAGGNCPEGTSCNGGFCNPPGVSADMCREGDDPDGGLGASDAGDASDVPTPDGMVRIRDEGIFIMGCTAGESACDVEEDETPLQTTRVPSYFIDVNEVTQEDYALCVTMGPCDEPTTDRYDPANNGRWPVVGVNRPMAEEYCMWRDDSRLPTEAQWEKAARGQSTGNIYPWGTDSPGCYVRAQYYDSASCMDRTDPVDVGSFEDYASDYGLNDMSGNAWEWVSDWYAPYSDQEELFDPKGPITPPAAMEGILRGGGFASELNPSRSLRVSNRYARPYMNTGISYGMRCAKRVNP